METSPTEDSQWNLYASQTNLHTHLSLVADYIVCTLVHTQHCPGLILRPPHQVKRITSSKTPQASLQPRMLKDQYVMYTRR